MVVKSEKGAARMVPKDLQTLFSIIVSLAVFLVFLCGALVFFLRRLLSDYDRQFTELFSITRNLPALERDLQLLREEHSRNHRGGNNAN
jgi:hypothetical protein